MNTPSNQPLKNIIIVGGGTAGWITAACLARVLKNQSCRVQLVESADIGTVGVGEATIPPIVDFVKFLGIEEKEFIQATQATFKLGIKFQDWRTVGQAYWHQFGTVGATIDKNPFYQLWRKSQFLGDTSDFTDYSPAIAMARQNKFIPQSAVDPKSLLAGSAYAWHFDATLVAKFLRDYSLANGVTRVEGEVVQATLADNGFIDKLILKDGSQMAADFYIDCSGFRGLLIEQALNTGYEDWTRYLPCDRAVAMPTKNSGPLTPYTLATARDSGWTWKIPLQHRTGNGYVYCSQFCSDEQAEQTLRHVVDGDPLAEPRLLRFTTGRRKQFWNKNCLAIGLSSGFMEPLESTSIHLIMRGVKKFVELYPDKSCDPVNARQYNRIMNIEYECIRDFIVLHYCTTQRTDTPFWNYCREMEVPGSLKERIEFFQSQGRLSRSEHDLFADLSWYAVLEGMGIRPRGYDPLVDLTDFDQVKSIFRQIRELLDNAVAQVPSHEEFIKRQCPAPISE